MNTQQSTVNAHRYVQAIRLTADTILAAVDAAGPTGQPEGPLYAALMPLGVTLPIFESLLKGLELAGRIRRNGHLIRLALPEPDLEMARR